MCWPTAYVAEVDYPEYGKRLKVHGSPWHFSETPARIGVSPKLGAHAEEVLARLATPGTDRGFAGTQDHLTIWDIVRGAVGGA